MLGRCSGSLARHRLTSGRSPAGRPPTSGGVKTTRYSSVALGPVPNGPSPVAAKVSTAPRLNTSLGGPTRWPRACSGDMKLGEPNTMPVPVSMLASAAREMPKSMTRGPSSASSTFGGFRSRCTMPAAWIAPRPWASSAASASTDVAAQRAVPGDRLGEGRPGDVGGGQPRHRCVYVGVNHRRREQAAHRPRRGDLAGEPVPEFGLPGQFGPGRSPRSAAPRVTGPGTPGPCLRCPAGPAASTGRLSADPGAATPAPCQPPAYDHLRFLSRTS